MIFRDITNDPKKTYRLGENEHVVFLMENRGGEVVFELTGEHAVAHIFAFYTGVDNEHFLPIIIQKHLAPNTVSSATVRARLDGSSSLRFRGLVEIAKGADGSDAKQDCRALLLSPEASASAVPELEIDTDDVTCSHAAAISAPDTDQINYLATRGVSPDQAVALIADGFFKDAKEMMSKLITNNSPLTSENHRTRKKYTQNISSPHHAERGFSLHKGSR
ncbi:MAG: SufD family Fe-S cluster assembly protein [Candidatus Moraniibacteriota bacterium]